MNHLIKLVALAGIGANLAACAVARPLFHGRDSRDRSPSSISNVRSYPESKDVVWQRVMAAVGTSGLSVKSSDESSGDLTAEKVIGFSNGIEPFASWATCGKIGWKTPVSQTVALSVSVQPTDAGASVSVSPHYSEVRQFGRFKQVTVECRSTGGLESEILGAVERSPQ